MTKIFSMFYSFPFEYMFTPRVIVVTEEQLAAEKRRVKQKEVDRLEKTLEQYEATYQRDVTEMKDRIAELNAELASLSGAGK